MLRYCFVIGLIGLSLGCSPKKKTNSKRQTGSRIAAVTSTKTTGAVNDKAGFCEKTYPAAGPDARIFKWPILRPLPGETKVRAVQQTKRWTWINLWATWCEPCMDEMALLGRWTRSLASEGQGISLELLTIDAIKDEGKLAKQIKKGLPGPVLWLNDPENFGPFPGPSRRRSWGGDSYSRFSRPQGSLEVCEWVPSML